MSNPLALSDSSHTDSSSTESETDLMDEETEDDDFPPVMDYPTDATATPPPPLPADTAPVSVPVPVPIPATVPPPGVGTAVELQASAEVPENEIGVEHAPDLGNGKVEVANVVKEEAREQGPPSPNFLEGGEESGTEEDQYMFMKELERFHKGRFLEFKPPKFYGEGLNCLKLWRAVARLGGYERVTYCKLWREVGKLFKPPKTCTTVSWTFRIFYEKALLEYEKHKIRTGQLVVPVDSICETPVTDKKMGGHHLSSSGRARRDAAARAMQGWHSQRLLGNGEVGDPIVKDKTSVSVYKRDKSYGGHKRKKTSSLERPSITPHTSFVRTQGDSMVVDVGEPADWVKVNVRRTKDCYEVYALVPGLLREEVRVQSDPCGRLIISGEPEHLDNPWGVAPFKKVITLPSRIDPHQTSAVVTLHGQLFVRAPYELSDL